MSGDSFRFSRRRFLRGVGGGALLGGLPEILRAQQAPAVVASERARPAALHGLQIGDSLANRAIVWSRANKEARMFVDWSTHESFANAVRIRGPHTLSVSELHRARRSHGSARRCGHFRPRAV